MYSRWLNCTVLATFALWACEWSHWRDTPPVAPVSFLMSWSEKPFPATCHSRPVIQTPDSFWIPVFSASLFLICLGVPPASALLRRLPIISVPSSPPLILLPAFSHVAPSSPSSKPVLRAVLSPFLFRIHPHYLLSCINHCLLLSGFLPPSPLNLPYNSFSASISGVHTADGGSPLSPLREQKVCPLPLRLCVMEHREIETEEREQMGGGHTDCLFYNITPNNAAVISMTA